jgi:hypothetical protein
METRIQIRRDTASHWTNNNPVLALGEMGFDTTNRQIRVGDGITPWNGLEILSSGPATGISYDNSVSGLVATTAQQAIDELADIKATYYKHDQQTPSNEWVINHNLGKLPSVTVIDTADTLVMGSVLFLNLNQVKISFTGSFAGKAYLV